MPARNALASVHVEYAQQPKGFHHFLLKVWNRSYDDPDPNRRNTLIDGVYFSKLVGANTGPLNSKITDRNGIDHTQAWRPRSGGAIAGFEGYTDWDAGGTCGPQMNGVVWGAFTGVYDERCLADLSCDARRLQTYFPGPLKELAFNYVLGPMTFEFDMKVPAVPPTIRLKFGHIGGNAGIPAQRWSNVPAEEIEIQCV